MIGEGMDFSFDIFTEEFPENQNTKIKTEEELAKLSTDENLTELDKAVYWLVKGYEIQKKSIIQNLRRYMYEMNSNTKLIPIIINSVDGWDMKFQIECANAFKEWCVNNLLAERHCDTLMQNAWAYI